MSEAKVNAYDYINFLIATSKHFSGLEASKVQPNLEHPPAHDSFNRLKPSFYFVVRSRGSCESSNRFADFADSTSSLTRGFHVA